APRPHGGEDRAQKRQCGRNPGGQTACLEITECRLKRFERLGERVAEVRLSAKVASLRKPIGNEIQLAVTWPPNVRFGEIFDEPTGQFLVALELHHEIDEHA